jgi:hypothetical protein
LLLRTLAGFVVESVELQLGLVSIDSLIGAEKVH